MSTSSHLPPVPPISPPAPAISQVGRRPSAGRYVAPVGSDVSLVGHYGVGSYSAVPNLPARRQTQEGLAQIGSAEAGKGVGRATHRIDPAHALANQSPTGETPEDQLAPAELAPMHAGQQGVDPVSERMPSGRDSVSIAPSRVEDSVSPRDEMHDGDSLLCLHGAELIEQLRAWAREIDARQAQLNAQQALQELQERQFRTWRSSEMQQIEEARRAVARERDALRRERAEVEGEREELMRAGRRLAAAQWASGT